MFPTSNWIKYDFRQKQELWHGSWATQVLNCAYAQNLSFVIVDKHVRIRGQQDFPDFLLELEHWPALVNKEGLWIFES